MKVCIPCLSQQTSFLMQLYICYNMSNDKKDSPTSWWIEFRKRHIWRDVLLQNVLRTGISFASLASGDWLQAHVFFGMQIPHSNGCLSHGIILLLMVVFVALRFIKTLVMCVQSWLFYPLLPNHLHPPDNFMFSVRF